MIRNSCNSIAYKMKRSTKLFCFLLCVCVPLFVSCAATKIHDSWKDREYQGHPQNMAVIMAARTEYLREMFEGRFAAELRARGINAVQSHKLVTFEELKDRELVKSRIKSSDADTVLISRLVDSKTIDTYEPGQIHGIPVHYAYWGTYYQVVFIDYGYTGDIQVAQIETNLYDVKTEKLIWSARSKVERSYGEQQLINMFIDRILKKLSSDDIIK